MTIREQLEEREEKYLSKYAALSSRSKGRKREEAQCDIRPVFQRDRDRILHCKAFRRLKQKTQVFLLPKGDHYRTRLTHTLEVSQNARTIAKALRLNEDLVEAIALGHDLGHTPFGHAGERALNEVNPFRFKHNEQSVRAVEYLEKGGEGLNLTWEVLDGIRNHQTSGKPSTLEGAIVRLSDKIAYINHDIDDAIRAGMLSKTASNVCKKLPAEPADKICSEIFSVSPSLTKCVKVYSAAGPDRALAKSIETKNPTSCTAVRTNPRRADERIYPATNKTAARSKITGKNFSMSIPSLFLSIFFHEPLKKRFLANSVWRCVI